MRGGRKKGLEEIVSTVKAMRRVRGRLLDPPRRHARDVRQPSTRPRSRPAPRPRPSAAASAASPSPAWWSARCSPAPDAGGGPPRRGLPWAAWTPRYRCDGCGNLTRFDVTVSQRTKAFYHFTVGGDLEVEDEEVLSREVDEVVCRWCGHGRSIVEISRRGARRAGRPSKVCGEPPADILRRLRPIPTSDGRPPRAPRDVVGVDARGRSVPDGGDGGRRAGAAPVPLGGLPRLPGPVGGPRPAAGGPRRRGPPGRRDEEPREQPSGAEAIDGRWPSRAPAHPRASPLVMSTRPTGTTGWRARPSSSWRPPRPCAPRAWPGAWSRPCGPPWPPCVTGSRVAPGARS